MVCQGKRKEEGCMRKEEKDTIGRYECCYIIFENISSVLQRKNRMERIRSEGKYKGIKKPVHF